MTSLANLKGKLLKDPEARAEYERQRPGFELARTLIEARSRANMTQAQVADAMGTTQSVVARLESGNAKPSWPSIERYAAAVGTEPKLALEPCRPAKSAPRRHARRVRSAKAAEAQAVA